MKTYFIQAEVLTVSMPDSEVDIDVDVYEIKANSPLEALETLRALKNRRGDWGASGVHATEILGCEEDAEADFSTT